MSTGRKNTCKLPIIELPKLWKANWKGMSNLYAAANTASDIKQNS